MAKRKESGFDNLARLIKNESDDIRKHMATKEDVGSILLELKDIKKRLGSLEEAVEDHSGHSKEIDHAFDRIATIEKHLGIKVKAH